MEELCVACTEEIGAADAAPRTGACRRGGGVSDNLDLRGVDRVAPSCGCGEGALLPLVGVAARPRSAGTGMPRHITGARGVGTPFGFEDELLTYDPYLDHADELQAAGAVTEWSLCGCGATYESIGTEAIEIRRTGTVGGTVGGIPLSTGVGTELVPEEATLQPTRLVVLTPLDEPIVVLLGLDIDASDVMNKVRPDWLES